MTTAKPAWGRRLAYWGRADFQLGDEARKKLNAMAARALRQTGCADPKQASDVFCSQVEVAIQEFIADSRFQQTIPSEAEVRAALGQVIAEANKLLTHLRKLDSRTRQLACITADVHPAFRQKVQTSGGTSANAVYRDPIEAAKTALDNLVLLFQLTLQRHATARAKGGRRRSSADEDLARKLAEIFRSCLSTEPTKSRTGLFERSLRIALAEASAKSSAATVHLLACKVLASKRPPRMQRKKSAKRNQ